MGCAHASHAQNKNRKNDHFFPPSAASAVAPTVTAVQQPRTAVEVTVVPSLGEVVEAVQPPLTISATDTRALNARSAAPLRDVAEANFRSTAEQEVSPTGKMVPAAAAATAAATAVVHEQDDFIGTNYRPPLGGREGPSLAAGGPTNLLEVPGVSCGDGHVQRPLVSLRNGALYEGQWRDMKTDGVGKLTWLTGEYYEGQFKNGVATGKGIWKDANGNVFEGQWKDNKIEGVGRFSYADGSVYEGEWSCDKKNGKGKETWGDGTVFDGQYKEGERQGKGKVTFPNGSTYEGDFVHDQFEGEGTYKWPSGRSYAGQWMGGQMHGKGVFVWPSGQMAKYEGTFRDGLRNGTGSLFMRDGRTYVAHFVSNKMDGEVTEIFPSGHTRKGLWHEGKHIKWLTEQQKIKLDLDTNEDGITEFCTSAFSNPSQYHRLHQEMPKEHKIVKEGVLTAAIHKPAVPSLPHTKEVFSQNGTQ